MFKRIIMGAGLGLALLGGGAATHFGGAASAHPAALHAAQVAASTGEIQTADAASTAPCTIDAAGNEDGNCQDSQNTAGGTDPSGTETPEAATSEGGTAGPDGDNVQADVQSGGNN